MKKAIAIVLLVLVFVVGVGFGATTLASEEDDFLVENSQREDGDTYIWTIRDNVTGVNYILVLRGIGGSCTICPRYDSDGSLYTGK